VGIKVSELRVYLCNRSVREKQEWFIAPPGIVWLFIRFLITFYAHKFCGDNVNVVNSHALDTTELF
jgi:hypothetical protein